MWEKHRSLFGDFPGDEPLAHKCGIVSVANLMAYHGIPTKEGVYDTLW